MKRSHPLLAMVMLLLGLPLLMGHGDGCGCGEEPSIELGPPTGMVCPPSGTSLTYEDFGEPFMAAYCLRCHSVNVTGADRNGAPGDHNFDTQFEALALKDHIDQMAGSGPDAVNMRMPVGDPTPSLEEREQLSEWLACDAP
jgi:hypothetical protein